MLLFSSRMILPACWYLTSSITIKGKYTHCLGFARVLYLLLPNGSGATTGHGFYNGKYWANTLCNETGVFGKQNGVFHDEILKQHRSSASKGNEHQVSECQSISLYCCVVRCPFFRKRREMCTPKNIRLPSQKSTALSGPVGYNGMRIEKKHEDVEQNR